MKDHHDEYPEELKDWCNEIAEMSKCNAHDLIPLYPYATTYGLTERQVADALMVLQRLEPGNQVAMLKKYIFERNRVEAQAKRNEIDNNKLWNRFLKKLDLYKDKPTRIMVNPSLRLPVEEIIMLNNVLGWPSVGRLADKI